MATFVSSERRDAVALVTIDNPPMNALSAALLEELEAELDALDADDAVRAIVLRGAGDRAFVAGADIKEFPALRESASEGGSARGIQQVGRRMDAARTPFVAAIRGYCLGGGLELAMCCDVRICADDATPGQPEIKLGLIPGGGGTQRLPRLVGHGRAMFLNLTGDFVDAQTAYAWGLVEKVVPAGNPGIASPLWNTGIGAVEVPNHNAAFVEVVTPEPKRFDVKATRPWPVIDGRTGD